MKKEEECSILIKQPRGRDFTLVLTDIIPQYGLNISIKW